MLNLICRIFILLIIAIPIIAIAESTGIGAVANNLIAPVYLISDFVGTASIIIGSSCLFASLIKYSQYRINPLAVPLSTVLVLFVTGLLLVLLPFAYKLTGNGIPYGVVAAGVPLHKK